MDEGKDFNFSNLLIKYLLFLINTVIWLLGIALLAIGIYVQVETTFDRLMLSDAFTNPAIGMIVIGSMLFILGFCGCLGALLEVFFLLVIYSVLLSLLVVGEIVLVIYAYAKQEDAYDTFEALLADAITRYFDDANLRDLINLIQGSLLKCCGITSPRDWEKNVYFNCSSPAFQRCSVPFSCCIQDDGDIINLQCGYRTLDNTSAQHMMGIYLSGCFTEGRNLVQANLYVFLGVGIGLLVFQLINIMLATGLAVDVNKEKKILKAQKKLKKQQDENVNISKL